MEECKGGRDAVYTPRSCGAEHPEQLECQRELLEHLPCGAAIFEADGQHLRVLAFNRRYYELTGQDNGDSRYDSTTLCMSPETLRSVLTEVEAARAEHRDISINVRIYSDRDACAPFHLAGRVVELGDGRALIYATYTPISAGELSLNELMPIMLSTMMAASADYGFVKDKNLRYICATRNLAHLVGLENEQEVIGKTDYDLFDPDLAEAYVTDDRLVIESGKSIVNKIESVVGKNGIRLYTSTSKYVLHNAQGNIVGLYGTSHQVPGPSSVKVLSPGSRIINDLLEQIPGGIAVHEIADGELTLLYLNDGFYRMVEAVPSAYARFFGSGAIQAFHPDDLPVCHAAMRRILDGADADSLILRTVKGDGSYKWMQIINRVVGRDAGRVTIYSCYFDMDQQVKLQNELLRQDQELRIVVQQSGKAVLRYDVATGDVTHDIHVSDGSHLPPMIPDFAQAMLRAGRVLPSSRRSFTDYFQRLRAGESPLSGDFHLNCSVDGPRWYHLDATVLRREDGSPDHAVISYSDVTELREEKARYEKSIAYRTQAEKNTLGSFRMNITQNIVDDRVSDLPPILALAAEGTVDGFFTAALSCIPVGPNRREYARLFSRKHLLSVFTAGKTQLRCEHPFLIDGSDPIWMCTVVDIARNPDTGDVECLLYGTDLTDQHQMKLLVDKIVDTDYDLIVVINVANDTYRSFLSKSSLYSIYQDRGLYSEALERLPEIVHPDDLDTAQYAMQIASIVRQLESADHANVWFRLIEGDDLRDKKLTYVWLDSSKRDILCFRQDVTELFAQEARQRQQMMEALALAKKANAAKSDFLSRMSHEIRTPLNAIIGCATVGLDDAAEQPACAEGFAQIVESGQYLLNLINDILDVSRIESGKLELHPGWYSMAELGAPVYEMVAPAMAAKNIRFLHPDMTTVNGCGAFQCYLDKMRLQQILINLLNNACKFTPEGGTVSWSFQHISHTEDEAIEIVNITDTGCGMSEEFIRHIGEPFSQERLRSSAGGTGLGLYIVKKICAAMGSRFSVESKLGQGSVFRVELRYPYRIQKLTPPARAKKPASLAHAHVLLAEDNALNRMVALKMLEKAEVIVDAVENGQLAVERFSASAPGYYRAILMDIQMPVMDGLEAAARIRALDRADAATVPIIALSANAFDSDVQRSLAAGMSAHLSKPIELSRLLSALSDHITADTDGSTEERGAPC